MKHKNLLFFTLILAILLIGVVTGYAQEAAGEAAAAPAKAQGDTLIKVILHGGPLIIGIWTAILAASISMVTFVIQNIISLRRQKLAPDALVNSLMGSMAAGNYAEALQTCTANDNYMANVLETGLSRLSRGKEAVEDAIAESALREAQILRTRNSYLSVIGVVSPMIGLLGTVIGMMGAFATLGASGISDPRGLATSIGEVLTATASGLFIAIPAFIFYYVFRNRSQMVIVYADDKINQVIADLPYEQLQGHVAHAAPARPAAPIGAYAAPAPAAPMGPPPTMMPRMGAPAPIAPRDPRSVSSSLMTKCPACNGLIAPGQTPCPHCHAALDWSN